MPTVRLISWPTGEILTLTYTATVNDGHGGVVTNPIHITVTGSNDTVEITSEAQAASISESNLGGETRAGSASGAITFTDADLTDTHTATITSFHATGVVTGLANGVVDPGWLKLGSLAIPPTACRVRRTGRSRRRRARLTISPRVSSVTLTYTVEVSDHHGGVTSQDITVTINGARCAGHRRHRAAR